MLVRDVTLNQGQRRRSCVLPHTQVGTPSLDERRCKLVSALLPVLAGHIEQRTGGGKTNRGCRLLRDVHRLVRQQPDPRGRARVEGAATEVDVPSDRQRVGAEFGRQSVGVRASVDSESREIRIESTFQRAS